MNEGQRITDRPLLEDIPEGSSYLLEAGDGSGTKRVRHETLVSEIEKALPIGDMEELRELEELEVAEDGQGAEDQEDKPKEPALTGKFTLVKAILKLLGIATSAFSGTDGVKPGTAGMVPPPAPEDEGKVLGAGGKWVTVESGGNSDSDEERKISAENVKFEDEKNAEEKLGDIDGITDDLNCENPKIAASAVGLKKVSDSVGFDTKLIDGVPNWSPRGADTWSPFRSSGTVYFKKGTSANFAGVIKSIGKNTTEFSSSNFRAIVTAIGAYSLKTNPNGGVARSLTASVTARNININYTNTTGVVSASCPNPTLTVPSDSVATAEGGNPAPTIFGFVFDPSATPFAG